MKAETITARMSFTAEELEILNTALNDYALKMMQNSETWGNAEEMIKRGDDYYAKVAHKADRIWCAVYDAQKRLETRKLKETILA